MWGLPCLSCPVMVSMTAQMRVRWEFWSLLRSWLRSHRGISQEKLPLYLAFFQFVHTAKKRDAAAMRDPPGQASGG